jgi:predicted O-methyltransferase YrrM
MSEFTAQMVPGWMSDEELALLARYAVGKKVVEVGVYKGRSAVGMLLAGATVYYGFDTFSGDAHTGKAPTLVEAHSAFIAAGVWDRVRLFCGDWHELLPGAPVSGFGFGFYDALHTYEDTLVAGLLLAHKMPGAPIGFHDCGVFPEVLPAVNEVARLSGREIVNEAGSIRVIGCPRNIA